MQMKRKIGYRLAHIFLVLLGVSFLSFLLMYVSPGDPVRAMYAVSGSIPSEEVLEQTREELGLNDPFFIQYGNWISNCLRGDFGTSYSKGEAVATLLMERVMPTIQLALLSLVIMVLVAVPIGVYSALRQNSILDYLLRGTTFISISMPNFWVGLLLLYVVAMKLGWLPVVSNQMNFQRLILPAVTLAIAMAGKYARQVRAAILEELRQDYVAGARARGLSERCVLWCHVLPNAVLPLITMLGLSLGSLLGGTAVVEVIFSYPALGSLAISAITSRDYPLIQGYVLWIALIYMAVNLVVDLSYNRLDPRLRKELQA
ncbi:ABC transporter permease subunit [Flavonifractor plautii]|jgi:peptide/nickel transport system permease protein|uniref:Nickel import system permease protein NikB n=2 Tax=Flavonifractor plautii TaxID=292800 RepID=A0A656CB82_FLAPL|nr:ABC transporter permease subunit [Flavonifractor plautii]MSB09151.1 ABC transporter permease subunit [Flavonifractor plautii]MSB50568.1 ABC transporter permease subunit [Flavonifractor plautii]CUP01380.1 peptide ABC transporter permease [Flavonifractor plautii]CUP17238.1 Nickel transport system permease protein nikB [Flavonifractor plautii]